VSGHAHDEAAVRVALYRLSRYCPETASRALAALSRLTVDTPGQPGAQTDEREVLLPRTSSTLREARDQLAGYHFGQESLHRSARGVLYIAEGLLRFVDELRAAGVSGGTPPSEPEVGAGVATPRRQEVTERVAAVSPSSDGRASQDRVAPGASGSLGGDTEAGLGGDGGPVAAGTALADLPSPNPPCWGQTGDEWDGIHAPGDCQACDAREDGSGTPTGSARLPEPDLLAAFGRAQYEADAEKVLARAESS
jgi:hypothetical protein